MKTAKGCKDVSSMSPQDEQYNRMQSNHKQKNSRRKFYGLQLSQLNQTIIQKAISNSSLNSHVYWDTLYI